MRTLDTVQPASIDNKLEEIVEWMCANYSVGRDRDKVEERVVWSVENLVSRQQQRWRVSAQQWTCSYQDCRNSNFGWRKYCNRCRQPKSPTKLSGRSKLGSQRRSPRRYKTCSHTHYSSSHLSKTSRGTTYSYSYKEKSRERSTERTGCRERFRERSRERSREICRLSERVERRRRSPNREERYEGRERNPTPGRGSDLQGALPPTSYLTQHPQFPNMFILNTLPPGRGFL